MRILAARGAQMLIYLAYPASGNGVFFSDNSGSPAETYGPAGSNTVGHRFEVRRVDPQFGRSQYTSPQRHLTCRTTT